MIGDETQVLIEGAIEGDHYARGDLLERLRGRIVLWCGHRMSPALRAKVQPEDAAQEVLLALHKALDGFELRGRREFLAWVFTIAENRIRNLVDFHGAQKRKTIEPRSFSMTSPSMAAGRMEEIRRLQDAMDELSDDHRLVIRLRRLEERSYMEIGEVMERHSAAVRALYFRALEALRGIVEKDIGG